MMQSIAEEPMSSPLTKLRAYRSPAIRDCVLVVVAIALATLFGSMLAHYLDEENVISVYLLAIVVISLTCSRAASLFSCAASVLCFDYFIMPPKFHLLPVDSSLWFSFIVMFAVATSISHLTSRIKSLADQLDLRVRQRTLELQEVNCSLRREVEQRTVAEKSLESLIRELTASNAVLMQMVRIASHDLQEPLRVIQGYSDLLKNRYAEKLDQNGAEFLDFIVEGTHRMESLIQGVLSHARIKQGTERFQCTDLNEVLKDVLSNIAVSVEQSGVTITHDQLPCVLADRTQLLQLFQNLMINAIRFRSEAPLIVHVSVAPGGSLWQFTVTDNGIGIDPKYHDEIFGMFKRLSSRMVPSGSGIGLAICKSVIENHNGKIWVESQLGSGSKFKFTLPAEEDEER
jgi:K+-sensing histidine kinase KdpD